VRCFGAEPEVLERVPRLILAGEPGEAGEGQEVSYPVESVAPGRRGELRVALEGVKDRDAAEALRGRRVLVEAAELEALPAGEYYGYQLVGCRIEGQDGAPVGTVREIWETGGPDLLVVEGRRAVVELVPGLLDGD
jgi:16S rRNA processing protein RimM